MQEIYPEWIRRKIEEYRNWMIGVRRQLHRYPETGDQEYETTKYIQNLLKEMEFEIENPLPTGVIGILKPGGTGGKCVALRADIDALPIQEETALPFRSERDGYMHACGHDLHMAALLCAARILSDCRSRLSAPVKFIFQPAEETDGGAARMIAAGCLEDPEVEYVLGWHAAPGVSFRVHRGPIRLYACFFGCLRYHGTRRQEPRRQSGGGRRRYRSGGADCHGGAEYRQPEYRGNGFLCYHDRQVSCGNGGKHYRGPGGTDRHDKDHFF